MQEPTGRKAILFIFITVLVDSIGFGIILPVMPELIMELTGADLSAASRYSGWLYFAFASVQFFCAPILGNLSDRFGRRPVLLSCLLAFGLDYIVMGISRTIGWLFFGRIVAGTQGACVLRASETSAEPGTPLVRRGHDHYRSA